MQVPIVPYDPSWPSQFRSIQADLARSLRMYGAPVLSIEHIGSTSMSYLYARPIMDVMVVVDRIEPFSRHGIVYQDRTHYALSQGGYTRIDSGGVPDVLCFRMFPDVAPRRHVYVVKEGGVVERCFRDVRDTLKKGEHRELKMRYGRVKMELAVREFEDVREYARAKDVCMREILRCAGWGRGQLEELRECEIGGWREDEEFRECIGFALGGSEEVFVEKKGDFELHSDEMDVDEPGQEA
ncbi:MAG: hypothetical protein Q9160_007894 [Pyrenula sp. 1 TL-2023]